MKSSKLKATLATVSAIAVMASASTSFAAVTTQSTYNTSTDKVSVVATVSELEANKEVTYLVKSGDQIVYIDQNTLDANGAATFTYKIAKSKILDLQTAVTYGTDGSKPAPDGDSLGFERVEATGEHVTIEYYTDPSCQNKISDEKVAIGSQEEIYAKVTEESGYEIESVTIGGESVSIGSKIYRLEKGKNLAVTTKVTKANPVVITSEPAQDDVTDMKVDVDGTPTEVKASVTTVLKVNKMDEVTEYGVIFNGVAYPAINTEKAANVAVRILTTDDKETISINDVKAYYRIDNTYYNINGTEIN